MEQDTEKIYEEARDFLLLKLKPLKTLEYLSVLESLKSFVDAEIEALSE
jgi:hypothetical protein